MFTPCRELPRTEHRSPRLMQRLFMQIIELLVLSEINIENNISKIKEIMQYKYKYSKSVPSVTIVTCICFSQFWFHEHNVLSAFVATLVCSK